MRQPRRRARRRRWRRRPSRHRLCHFVRSFFNMCSADGTLGRMAALPEAVRRQALHPFFELPRPASTKHFELDGAVLTINPNPNAQMAFPTSVNIDVTALVDQTRAIARERGKPAVAWWV